MRLGHKVLLLLRQSWQRAISLLIIFICNPYLFLVVLDFFWLIDGVVSCILTRRSREASVDLFRSLMTQLWLAFVVIMNRLVHGHDIFLSIGSIPFVSLLTNSLFKIDRSESRLALPHWLEVRQEVFALVHHTRRSSEDLGVLLHWGEISIHIDFYRVVHFSKSSIFRSHFSRFYATPGIGAYCLSVISLGLTFFSLEFGTFCHWNCEKLVAHMLLASASCWQLSFALITLRGNFCILIFLLFRSDAFCNMSWKCCKLFVRNRAL